jgi:hypothetical protein
MNSATPNSFPTKAATPIPKTYAKFSAFDNAKTPPLKVAWLDVLLASVLTILSVLMVEWLFDGTWYGIKITLFTLIYCGSILTYIHKKGIQQTKESWYWLSLLILTSFGYTFWNNASAVNSPATAFFIFLQFCFLFALAWYWSAIALGGLLLKKTQNMLLLDIINITLIVPFNNFTIGIKMLKFARQSRPRQSATKTQKFEIVKSILAVLLGVIITIPLLKIIFPTLIAADSSGGTFFQVVDSTFWAILDTFEQFIFLYSINWVQLFFTIFTVLYLNGMVLGFAHKRATANFNIVKVNKIVARFHFVPTISILTLLNIVLALYFIFIATQFDYFFAAFSGKLPVNQQFYSEYARLGFFELCNIVFINLLILLGCNLYCKVPRKKQRLLKIFNIAIALVTIILILTAFSKMYLYVSLYGFTIRRVLVCSFLLFLLFVWGGIVAMQWFDFSIVRFGLIVGCAILCFLCTIDIGTQINNYNLAHGYPIETAINYEREV